MSIISPISSTLYNPIYVAPVIPASAATQPSDAVLNEVTTVNANGTITTVTTFVNGATDIRTEIDPNAPPAATANGQGLLNANNTGQVGVLLNAQALNSIFLIGS